ncbi:glycosyltransferase family 2 protein [Roseobacter sp. CCS2]|uniref:glycosyltransferase family 2 protein n=1 Tax=Roseobacter sp. CCS2 TaxID=391593 RepID=UPI0018DBBBC4|nr:glycosyltransferase family 2 protein [Roseobacter sp. CCS2]
MIPTVSVIMANYNAADHVLAALKSVLAQSIPEVEILLADDASTDASITIARQIAAADPRLIILESDTNAGPAAVRNRALDVAKGEWVAIVDSDDIIHPQRFERMLSAARALQTEAIADDLTYLIDDTVHPNMTLLGDVRFVNPQTLTAQNFLSTTPRAPELGYLKPMFRADALNGLRYREDIRIGEDNDFYIRFLLNGGQMHLLPESYYLYRRHAQSLSHRMCPEDVQTMITVLDDTLIRYPNLSDDLKAAFAARRAALQTPLAFETLAQNIKAGRYVSATGDLIRKPALLGPLGRVAKDRFAWPLKKPAKQTGLTTNPSDWTAQDWSANQATRS